MALCERVDEIIKTIPHVVPVEGLHAALRIICLGIACSVIDEGEAGWHQLNGAEAQGLAVANFVAHAFFEGNSHEQSTQFAGFEIGKVDARRKTGIIIEWLDKAIGGSATEKNQFWRC